MQMCKGGWKDEGGGVREERREGGGEGRRGEWEVEGGREGGGGRMGED